ncbi:MAG: universal stress protein [Sphaerobacter sp.]|nr:universal stress protein [Sphaerobacter sp.]MDI3341386.1 universal stress protein [Sphaerobacter sp.]
MAIFDTILVPLDGSPLAETAVPYAAALARATGAQIVLLRVIEEMRPLYDVRRREVVWVDPAHPRQDLMSPEVLAPVAERLAADGLTVQSVVRLGDPRREILTEAGRYPAPIIVISSHGRGGLGRVVLGSVANRVLQMASCPVLVIRPRGAEAAPATVAFARIAVPVDGSALAEQALPIAVELARATGATLHLVRVAETFRDELPDESELSFRTPSFQAILEWFDQLEAEARTYLQETATRLQEQGLDVTWEVRSGNPWDQILAFSTEARPDLIVMTTHGRGGLARWFYGSVADKLLTQSAVPLLLIRAREQ